jgi:lipoprotein-anchoring transpeptidase ErfK/SrfK
MKRIGVIIVGVGLVFGLASCSSGKPPAQSQSSTPDAQTSTTTKTPTTVLPRVATGTTLLANVHRNIPGYVSAGGAQTVTIPASWHGSPSTLPVIGHSPGWLDVRLAQRPNESTAWVHYTDVTLTSSAYKILIDLKTTRLTLFKNNKIEFSAPAGVGTQSDPTPTGNFFVALFAAPPSAGYGPFVLVSSAHSNTISDWEMSGDALMAIHGPLGADTQIGTTGAYVSHGCVRLHLSDLSHLRIVPAGSPIVVIAG